MQPLKQFNLIPAFVYAAQQSTIKLTKINYIFYLACVCILEIKSRHEDNTRSVWTTFRLRQHFTDMVQCMLDDAGCTAQPITRASKQFNIFHIRSDRWLICLRAQTLHWTRMNGENYPAIDTFKRYLGRKFVCFKCV